MSQQGLERENGSRAVPLSSHCGPARRQLRLAGAGSIHSPSPNSDHQEPRGETFGGKERPRPGWEI